MNLLKSNKCIIDVYDPIVKKEDCAKEYKLKEAIKEANSKEFDKWMNDLIKRNTCMRLILKNCHNCQIKLFHVCFYLNL